MTKTSGADKTFYVSDLMKKAGGAFKFTTLMQKRLREINAGDRPLVDVDSDDLLEIVAEEFRHDKISLIPVDAEEDSEVPGSTDFSND